MRNRNCVFIIIITGFWRSTRKQKAIIVSGFSETDRFKEAQKRGAGAYVKKPYITEKIDVPIRAELDGK